MKILTSPIATIKNVFSRQSERVDSSEKISTYRADSWSNAYTGQNIKGRDRKASYQFIKDVASSRDELDTIYRFNGVARKIIDLIPEEMVREWFSVDEDTEGAIQEKLEDLNASSLFERLLSLDRLYGGAIIFIGIDDGRPMDAEVNEKAIKSIDFMRVFDRFQVQKTERYQDPKNKNFGEIEFYYVKPILIENASEIKIHSTRVIRLGGCDVPDTVRIENDGWGDSQICSIFEQLKNIGIAYNSTADILETYDQPVLQMPNLVQLIAAGNQDVVYQRLAALDISRGITNSIAIGADETYEKKTTPVSGIDQLIHTFELAVSSVSGIPHSKLFGISVGGLSNTEKSDIRNFYDTIKSKQNKILKPGLDKLIRYIVLSRDVKLASRDPKDYCVDFTSLWQLDELDQAELKLKNAQSDNIYINAGVLSNEMVSRSRFFGPQYGDEITLTESEEKAIQP